MAFYIYNLQYNSNKQINGGWHNWNQGSVIYNLLFNCNKQYLNIPSPATTTIFSHPFWAASPTSLAWVLSVLFICKIVIVILSHYYVLSIITCGVRGGMRLRGTRKVDMLKRSIKTLYLVAGWWDGDIYHNDNLPLWQSRAKVLVSRWASCAQLYAPQHSLDQHHVIIWTCRIVIIVCEHQVPYISILWSGSQYPSEQSTSDVAGGNAALHFNKLGYYPPKVSS